MIGLAMIKAVTVTPFPRLLSSIGAAAVIPLGAINIKDYFWPGWGLNLKISSSNWRLNAGWMRKATVPSAFVVGLTVSIIEFPYTGGIYLAILGLLASKTIFFQGLTLMWPLCFH